VVFRGGTNDKTLLVSGRLTHHIQDMSTPSHVVPVYHGPGLKDEYENFGAEYAGKVSTIFSADKSNSILDNRLAISVTVNDINGHNEAIIGTSEHILHNLHISSVSFWPPCSKTIEYLDIWKYFWISRQCMLSVRVRSYPSS